MRFVLFRYQSKYHNTMSVIMFADYNSAHMEALCSFLIFQNRTA